MGFRILSHRDKIFQPGTQVPGLKYKRIGVPLGTAYFCIFIGQFIKSSQMPNTYSQIYSHFVFSPKYRDALIIPEFEEELYKYITGVVKNLDQHLIRINGMPDHCHLLVRLRPSIAPSKLIQAVKTNSSRWVNERKFLNHRFNWQTGGGIFSVSYRNVPELINYIENQKQHHEKSNFKIEYLELLNHYGIDFEEEYLLEFF